MNPNRESLQSAVQDETFSGFDRILDGYHPRIQTREVGTVRSVDRGIATV